MKNGSTAPGITLRKQWQQELREKFSLPSVILKASTYREAIMALPRQTVGLGLKLEGTSFLLCSGQIR